MPQLELDPSDSQTKGSISLARPASNSTRNFGRFPNTADWSPGDIVLLRSADPSWISRLIMRAQEKKYAIEHARWTHVAVYIGDEHICEALPCKGVVYHRIDHYVGARIMRVRRPLHLSDAQRYRLCIETLVQLKKQYSIWKALFGLLGSFTLRSIESTAPVVCSQLYAIAYVRATNLILLGEALVTPAHLSAAAELEDIPVHWAVIA